MSPIVVLGYHRLEESKNPIATAPRLFAAHMRWLVEHGYSPLRLSEFEAALDGNPVGNKRVLITFDDGYESLFHHGLPVLRDFGFPAVNFLITSTPGNPEHLSWAQVAALEASGVFQTQSHSHSHIRWPSLEAMSRDIALSRSLLVEHLELRAEAIRHLAWPWGRTETGWASAAHAEGYGYQYLVRPQAVRGMTSSLSIPRLCCDAYSLERFALMMHLLSNPLASQATGVAWQMLKWRKKHAV